MAGVSALTRGEIQGLGVETYIRREMNKNRTHIKFKTLSIVLAGGHFSCEQSG